MCNRFGLVKAGFKRDALGQAGPEGIDLFVEIVANNKNIDAELAFGADQDGAFAIIAGQVARFIIIPLDLGDIANGERAAGGRAQRRSPDLVQTVERTCGGDVETPSSAIHRTDRNVRPFALQGVNNREGGEFKLSKAVEIQRYAHFGFRSAPDLRCLDAGSAFQHVTQVAGGRFELAGWRGFADERQHNDIGVGSVCLERADFNHALREVRAHDVQLTDEFVILAFRIRTVGELDAYRANARTGA